MRRRTLATFLLTGLLGWSTAAAGEASQSAKSPSADRTIAVLEFVDRGPSVELAVLRTALAEMLSGDLSQYQGLRVVERARVDQFLRESDLQERLVDGAAGQSAGKALAAEYLLTGTFQGKEKTVTVKATLLETSTARPLAQWTQSAKATDLVDLEQELVSKVLASLGIDKPVRRAPPKAQQGPSATAAVLALRNLGPSARLDPMQSGFADILQANLGALDNVRLVEREKLYSVLKEQELSVSGLVDPATAVKVGRLLGAQRLIYGSFVELGESLRLDLRLADTETASIIRAETAHGPTESFADLIEDLALRLAADLSVEPPSNAAELVKAATPTRKIEAAIHFADARLAWSQGRREAAAKAYERVLLIEPMNRPVAISRVKAWYEQGDWQETIKAGEHVINKGLVPSGQWDKHVFYDWMTTAYGRTENHEGKNQINRRIIAEMPGSRYERSARTNIALNYMLMNRRDEGIALLEQVATNAKARSDAKAYREALEGLLNYYHNEPSFRVGSHEYQRRKNDRDFRRMVDQQNQDGSKRGKEVIQRIFADVQQNGSNPWLSWAKRHKLPSSRFFQTKEEKQAYRDRIAKLFPELGKSPFDVQAALARSAKESGNWQEAIGALGYLAQHWPKTDRHRLPAVWDLTSGVTLPSRIREIVECQYEIAEIYHEHLGNTEKALHQYGQIIEELGVAHRYGARSVLGMRALGRDFALPAKAALLWGGGDGGYEVWSNVLQPMGFAVHGVRQKYISTAHLTPYSLVILVRSGILNYSPGEVLALRSYVATGGSLLVVVSPGWEPAQPSIHNSLLSFFNVKAESQMAVRAHSTEIAAHPITQAVDKVMAKNAVNLQVPPKTALIRAGDRTVLAAMSYRQGRVVVASFAQWFHPEPGYDVNALLEVGKHHSTQVPRQDRPVEPGPGLHLPLLRNVVSWLAGPSDVGPSDGGPGTAAQRQAFVDAQRAYLRAQFGVTPRKALAATMDGLIAEAAPGTWREEALWAAGESSLEYVTDALERPDYRKYNWWCGDDPSSPARAARYYRRLIDEFPDSPMRPFAQWRLADCKRRESGPRGSKITDIGPAIPLFQSVSAAEGTHAWAWAKLRLGQLQFDSADCAAALPFLKEVANRMEAGPEKSLALVNIGRCYLGLQDLDESMRYCDIALETPNIFWTSSSSMEAWGAFLRYGSTYPKDTKTILSRRIQMLRRSKDAQAKANDETPHMQKIRVALQQKHADLPSAEVNTQQDNVNFTTLDLSKTLTEVEGKRYYALRFTTPEKTGHLVWSFKAPEGAFRWYIVAAKGRMNGFTDFHHRELAGAVPDVGKRGDTFVLQRLPARNLKPNTGYIMWFGLREGGEPNVTLSLNVFPGASHRAYADVFPILYQE